MFSFKESFSLSDIENLFLKLGSLKDKIPQIKSYSYGKNNSNENLNRGFDYGFVMDFDSEQERDIYVDHTEHIKLVQELILPNLKEESNSSLVLDYHY